MDAYEWIGIGIILALYAVPFGVGLIISSRRKALMLSLASFAGVYLSIWSMAGPLFLPLAAQLVSRFELAEWLVLSFVAGALQAALVASLGFGIKKLVLWACARSDAPRQSDDATNAIDGTLPGKA